MVERKSKSKVNLSLPLLVFRVDANHTHHSLAVNDFALVTHFLYRSPNFHFINPQISAIQSRDDYHLYRPGNSSAVPVIGREPY